METGILLTLLVFIGSAVLFVTGIVPGSMWPRCS